LPLWRATDRPAVFRGPLARSHPNPDDLRAAVIETLHHEIGHHFGISDQRLGELRRSG